MKKKTAVIPFERIVSVIHVIRGQKVMLDRDLAVLYGVETRALNQAVKRNTERFPSDFMFELTREEIRNISQSVICSATLKHAPKVFAFTEQGVAMLSGVLHSRQAVEVNVAIMRAFIRLREFLLSQARFGRKLREIEQKVEEHHENIDILFKAFHELTTENAPLVGFQYDADSETEDETGRQKILLVLKKHGMVKERRVCYTVRKNKKKKTRNRS